MADSNIYNLKSQDHYGKVVLDSFWELLGMESLTDCTLVCTPTESVKVHRLILSANSPYFRSLLSSHSNHPHPIIILHDVGYNTLRQIVTFMYRGEVNVSEIEMQQLLKTAENLQIIGLSQGRSERVNTVVPMTNDRDRQRQLSGPQPQPPPPVPVYSKKARILEQNHYVNNEPEQSSPLALRKKESLSAPSTPLPSSSTTDTSFYKYDKYDSNSNSSGLSEEMRREEATNVSPTTPTTFTCPYCPTTTQQNHNTQSNLSRHIIINHPNIYNDKTPNNSTGNSITCKFCGKPFTEVSELIQHLPIHTGERPFKCEFCGKAFKLRHHMKDHARVHTGERPFRCSLCGKTFSRSTILKAHEKTHFPKGSGGDDFNK